MPDRADPSPGRVRVAVYPGSFDPLTNGHIDIIERGARIFDVIVVAILVNAEKSPLFTMQERVDIVREVFRGRPHVEVDTFDGLLVDYVSRREAQVIVRGLRAVSDFEVEFSYISSRLIKEVFSLGGRVSGLVPETVERRLHEKRGD
jgi:pantetheine-phosphate adenylyltransferase